MKRRVRKVRKVKKVRKNPVQRTAVFEQLYDQGLTDFTDKGFADAFLIERGVTPLDDDEFQEYMVFVQEKNVEELNKIRQMTSDVGTSTKIPIITPSGTEQVDKPTDTEDFTIGEEEGDGFTVGGEEGESSIFDDDEDTVEPEVKKTSTRIPITPTTEKSDKPVEEEEVSFLNLQATDIGGETDDNQQQDFQTITPDANLRMTVEEEEESEKALQLKKIFAESQQKVAFYDSQTKGKGRDGKQPYLVRFKNFIQFLPTTKREGFRTLPLPPAFRFGEWVQSLNDNQFMQYFGKQKSNDVSKDEQWKYLTAQYGTPIGVSSGKPAGVGTILVYVRRNGHTQMFIPSITPMQSKRTGYLQWSPSAEFVSRPSIAFFGPENATEIGKMINRKTNADEILIKQLSAYNKKRQFGSYPQMLMYIQSWRNQNPRAVQKRSVMPVLVFKETEGNIPVFVKAFRGTTSRLSMNIQNMIESGNVEEQSAEFTGDNLNDDLRRLIQMANNEMRNNPLFKKRIQKRVKKRRR